MKNIVALSLILFATITLTAAPVTAQQTKPIAFGVLPVVQALPLFVAQEKGLFDEAGVKVDLVPFRTALEKDVAMTAGQLDGYFGDLFTPVVLAAGGTKIKIVARNFVTGEGQRMFGVIAGPQSNLKTLADLADVPVAVSRHSIIEYATVTLLTRGGVNPDNIRLMEVKAIPIRFQMLMSDQVKAATLPEPLVTLVESKGGKVLADDGGSAMSSTVLIFTDSFLNAHPDQAVAFLKAVSKAVDLINQGGDDIKAIMNRAGNVPKPLHGVYAVPRFPKLSAPGEQEVETAVNWLKERGAIKKTLPYSELVDGKYIP
jgi:NitT/TauT family transport system substrate-binding protein